MDHTKLRIDLSQGVIEAEGNEAFVLRIYNDFKGLLSTGPRKPQARSSTSKTAEPPSATLEKKVAKRRGAKSKSSPSILKDLDLSPQRDILSLRDFYALYNVKSNYERNLIIVYYLEHILELASITLDHVFTCYRHVNVKVPHALQQSLRDTSSRRGWLDTSSGDNLKVTVGGVNYIEHDIKRSEAESNERVS
jgi:hypothetical protein